MILLRIKDSGKYDTTQVVEIAADGSFIIEKVVLDDYQLAAVGDTTAYPDHLPTYYKKAIFWEEADTLHLQDNAENLNITIVIYKQTSLGGDGSISGIVEEEISNSGGKIMIRRRMANARVSVRRARRSGRTSIIEQSRILLETELVGYAKTTKTGTFIFPKLPNDTYYLNIQYPGYPMDSTSFIEITINSSTTGRVDNVEVEALVDKGKISVKQVNITAIFKEDLYPLINIYPNPADQFIIIDLADYDKKFNLLMYDKSGRLVDQRKNLTRSTSLDIQYLNKGIYILRLFDDNDQLATSFKIMIK